MDSAENDTFLNPQGRSRYMRADIVIARKPDTLSPVTDAIHLDFSPNGGQTDEDFKADILAELSEMIRHEDDPTVPHMYDLQLKESHVNWGASGDSISILLEVSQALPAAVIGFYAERILARLGSKREVRHSRDEAIEIATSRIVTTYAVDRLQLNLIGDEELRDGGWNVRFRSDDGASYEVDIDAHGTTYAKREMD